MKKGITEGEVVVKKKSERIIETSKVLPSSFPSSDTAPASPAPSAEETKPEEETISLPLQYTEAESENELDEETLPARIEEEIESSLRPVLSHHILAAKTREQGDFLVFTVESQIARDMLGNYKKEIEKAAFSILGTKPQIRIEYVPAEGEKASEKILALQSILGGKIHIDRDGIEMKKESVEQRAEEEKVEPLSSETEDNLTSDNPDEEDDEE